MQEQERPDGQRIRPLDAFRRLWKPSDDGFIEGLTTPQRSVLAVLVVHANGDGLAWPSYPNIATGSGLGRSTVARVLGELEALGAITRTSNPPKSTRYTVPLWDSPALGQSRSERETVSLRESDSPAAGHELLKELPNEQQEVLEQRSRYSSEQLTIIDRAIDAFRSTRKTKCIADSVILTEFRWWKGHPVDYVVEGLRIYVEKGCAAEGKNEKYARGVIRNCNDTRVAAFRQQPKSAGEYARLGTADLDQVTLNTLEAMREIAT